MNKPASQVPAFGKELQRARKAAQMTLDDLARRSGVSKSILSQIERDSTNPTLATIWRICTALDFAPERLFRDSGREDSAIELLADAATPEIRSDDGLCRLRILGAVDLVDSLQWYDMEVDPGGRLLSEDHGAGSIEHLTVIQGALTVMANGESQQAKVGDTLRYATAEGGHEIVNTGKKPARAFMVCVLRRDL